MENIRFLTIQMEMDMHNIQELLNRIPSSKSKGEKRSLEANIKVLVKEIHNSKVLIEGRMFDNQQKVSLPLFECEPTKLAPVEEYQNIDSFFGELD